MKPVDPNTWMSSIQINNMKGRPGRRMEGGRREQRRGDKKPSVAGP
jgi:hypothetical protein